LARVVLFDIDNTLLYTGGAGGVAMSQAFEELYGIPDGFSGIEFSGRTDLYILEEALRKHGVEGSASENMATYTSLYYELLPGAIELCRSKGHVNPGFPELVRALVDFGATVGLATGNFSRAGHIKIEAYGLGGLFTAGGYGEISLDRADVVADAIRNVANGAKPGDIVVVGDTPHDITAATANGAKSVGVATGHDSEEVLRASGATATYPDFTNWQAAADQLLAL